MYKSLSTSFDFSLLTLIDRGVNECLHLFYLQKGFPVNLLICFVTETVLFSEKKNRNGS